MHSTSNKKSLSDLWRLNRSSDPGIDLVSILDGAKIMAQSLVPGTEVVFRGVKTASTDLKKIYLSPKTLGDCNEYPVSGNKVDELLGLTIHEIGHILFSSDRNDYMQGILRKIPIHSSDERQTIDRLVSIYEDIFVDHLMSAYPGYRDYLQRERDAALAEFDMDEAIKPLQAGDCDRLDMINALIYATLSDNQLPTNITPENLQILGGLIDIAMKMCSKKMAKNKAVIAAWNTLSRLPAHSDHQQTEQMMQQEQQPGDNQSGGSSEKQDNTSEQTADDKSDEAKSGDGESGESDDADEQEQTDTDDGESKENGDEDEAEETEQKTNESKNESDSEEDDSEESDSQDDEDGSGEPDTEPEEQDTKLPEGLDEQKETDTEENEPDETNEPDIPTESDTEPQTQSLKFKQQDLAAHLDDTVNDQTELPGKLAKDVADAMSEKRDDLSQLISYLAGDSPRSIIAYTPDENASAVAEAREQTYSVEEKLRRILQDYRLKHTKDYRGMMSGRVSSRRLHRVAYGDQRVFQRRERPDEIDMAVCLLMDLSGSMCSSKEIINQIITALTDAFTKEKVEFIGLGYSDQSHTVYTPRLYDKESGKINLGMDGDKCWGTTPSYEGLIVAEAQLLRLTGNKKKILFHFTDGQPNTSESYAIPELLQDIHSKGITTINICLGDNKLDRFIRIYGADLMAVNNIDQLPDLIDQKLRQIMM